MCEALFHGKEYNRERKKERYIEDTKTNAGTRILPMTDDVYECFKKIVENRSVYYGKNVPLFQRNGYRKSGAMIP